MNQGRLRGHKAVKDYEGTREGDLGNDDVCECASTVAGLEVVASVGLSGPDSKQVNSRISNQLKNR